MAACSTERIARALAEEADVDTFPHCSMCLFDVAWAIHQGRPVRPALVTRTADWV